MTYHLSDRRRVGRTELHVPPFGFGAAHLGGMYHKVPQALATETLAAAWEGGVRFFDTAPWYGRGLSELRVGNFLLDKPRDDFILTTKIGRSLHRPKDPSHFDRAPWGGGLNMEVRWDYSYDGVMRAYEQSLLRLGLDRIDALLIHDPEAAAEPGGPRIADLKASGYRALEELKARGEIKAIGMGLNAAASLDSYARAVPLDFVIIAMPYTLLDQSALEHGLQRCVDDDVSVVIGAPYASGILATGPIPGARYRYGLADAEILDKTRKIATVCASHKVSLQAAALQFPLAHPATVAVIPGGSTPAEVRSNLQFLAEPIPKSLWSDLKSENLISTAAPV